MSSFFHADQSSWSHSIHQRDTWEKNGFWHLISQEQCILLYDSDLDMHKSGGLSPVLVD